MAERKFFVDAVELRKVYLELNSVEKVARHFNVSKKLILNYMKRFDIKRNTRKSVKDYLPKLQELAALNKTAKEISLELRIDITLVNRYLKQCGIEVKRYHKGFITDSAGYILVKNPKHLNAAKNGYVREHILKLTESLGRSLTEDEVVHHIDFNKSNNELSNLQLMTKYEHKSFHSKLKRKRNL